MITMRIISPESYLIIDYDSIMYAVGATIPQKEAAEEPISHVYHSLISRVTEVREHCPANHELIYMTSQDKSNFRFARAETPCRKRPRGKQEYDLYGYKANRQGLKKPYHYQMIREFSIEKFNAISVEGMEADDMVLIQATKPGRIATIATGDKDIWQYCGDVFRYDQKQLYKYDPSWGEIGTLWLTNKRKLIGRGRAWFYAQLLLGDAMDNIPGVLGCGDVGAYKFLKTCTKEEEYYNVIKTIYKEKFGDRAKSRFMEVACLLWMRTNDIRCIETYLENSYDF